MSYGIHLVCDDPVKPKGTICTNRFHYGSVMELQKIRQHAATFGWVHVDGKDLCPEHDPNKRERIQ